MKILKECELFLPSGKIDKSSRFTCILPAFSAEKHLTYRNSDPYNRQENRIVKDCDGDSKLILNVWDHMGRSIPGSFQRGGDGVSPTQVDSAEDHSGVLSLKGQVGDNGIPPLQGACIGYSCKPVQCNRWYNECWQLSSFCRMRAFFMQWEIPQTFCTNSGIFTAIDW